MRKIGATWKKLFADRWAEKVSRSIHFLVALTGFKFQCKCRHRWRNKWVHFYEPKRKHHKKKLSSYDQYKEFSVIFFTTQDPARQVAVPKDISVKAKVYKSKVLRKLNKYFRKHRHTTGFAKCLIAARQRVITKCVYSARHSEAKEKSLCSTNLRIHSTQFQRWQKNNFQVKIFVSANSSAL
jgi:hypothetical protein